MGIRQVGLVDDDKWEGAGQRTQRVSSHVGGALSSVRHLRVLTQTSNFSSSFLLHSFPSHSWISPTTDPS